MNSLDINPDSYAIILQRGELTHRFKEESDRIPSLSTQKKMMMVASERLFLRPNEEYVAYAKFLLKRYGNNSAIASEASLLSAVVNKNLVIRDLVVKPEIQRIDYALCAGGIQAALVHCQESPYH